MCTIGTCHRSCFFTLEVCFVNNKVLVEIKAIAVTTLIVVIHTTDSSWSTFDISILNCRLPFRKDSEIPISLILCICVLLLYCCTYYTIYTYRFPGRFYDDIAKGLYHRYLAIFTVEFVTFTGITHLSV